MKRLYFQLTALMMVFLIVNPKIFAQTDPINVVTTAVPFLRISPDARAGGMGELGLATSPDAASSFYNQAKAPFAKFNSGIGITYTPWLKDLGLNDVYLLAASGYHKIDDQSSLSASLRYFSLGNIQFTDYSGQEIGNGRPRELGADLGYARKLSGNLSLGIALRYIYSNLTAGFPGTGGTSYKAGTAFAGDISLFYTAAKENGEGFNFGLVASNLGTKIGYTNDASAKEYIPANLGLGTTYTHNFDEQSKVSFGLDINKLLVPALSATADSTDLANYHSESVVSSWFKSFSNSAYNFSLGGEYGYNEQFFFRAGYFYEAKNQGGRQYLSLGLGLKYNVIGLNFSYLIPSGSGVTRNPLSNTIRFGLVFDLDGGEDNK